MSNSFEEYGTNCGFFFGVIRYKMYGRYPVEDEVKKLDLPSDVVVWCGEAVDFSGELHRKISELAIWIKKVMSDS